MKMLRCFIPTIVCVGLFLFLAGIGVAEIRPYDWNFGKFVSDVVGCVIAIDLFKAISPRYLRDE